MKNIITSALLSAVLFSSVNASAQAEDKTKRPSPPAKLTSSANGLDLIIDYSQPAMNGRTFGTDVAPYGQVWRTGANEATTIELSRDVKVEGKELKAGKYSLFTIPNENEWVVIFNKTPTQWGAFRYDEKQDALRVNVKPAKAATATERMTFSRDGDKVILLWGDKQVPITIQ